MANQSLDTVKIGNLGRVITGKTPPTIRPELFGDEYPFITPTDIQEDSRIVETARFLSEAGRAFQKNLLLPVGTVCYTCIGATIGKICITTKPSFTNQQINSIIPDETQYDNRFIYYLLKQETPHIKVNAGGAATPIINKSVFSEIEVNVPPLPVQRRIADILSAYDDLIENNTRRIRILEQMAQAIYQEWFGRVDKESLPKGWELVKLGDVADIQWGDTSVTKASYVAEGFTAYSASGADGKLDYYDFDRKGIVLSAIGANCGKTWFAIGKWSCIKNTIRFWSSSNRVSTEYLFFTTADENFWTKRGAAQPFISQGDARNTFIICPDKETMDNFTNFASDTLEEINLLEKKNANLRQTRDLLLPRLVSGEVEV